MMNDMMVDNAGGGTIISICAAQEERPESVTNFTIFASPISPIPTQPGSYLEAAGSGAPLVRFRLIS